MSMIDRVANAIIDMNFPDAVAVDLPVVEHYRRQARVIIEAMREPTKAMLAAPEMKNWAWRDEERVDPEQIADAWRSMIDAAIASETNKMARGNA